MLEIDEMISFSIIMLLLSFITERVANFLKLHFQNRTISIPWLHYPKTNEVQEQEPVEKPQRQWWLKANLQILAYRQATEAAEKEREWRILTINIIIGIFVAAINRADFFYIVKHLENGGKREEAFQEPVLFWVYAYLFLLLWSVSVLLFNRLEEVEYRIDGTYPRGFFYFLLIASLGVLVVLKDTDIAAVIIHSIGIIITGIFLSLGSKFWHDLLDLLFSIKNVRTRLSEQETFTNYTSAQQIIALAETNRYDVTKKLHDKYASQILKVEGVLSCGINQKPNQRIKLYTSFIEVEYNGIPAQAALMKIKEEGFIVINHNTFYLKDYMELLYTKNLSVLLSLSSQSEIEKPPVCYAHNSHSDKIKGSFSVERRNGQFYAVSNLHVFAAQSDMKQFANQSYANLNHEKVKLIIGNKDFEGTIEPDYKLGRHGTYDYDYCTCKVDEDAYKAYQEIVESQIQLPKDEQSMTMFGAVSKNIVFLPNRMPTICRINYADLFRKEMYLLKIATNELDNIQYGDSGAIINFRETGLNNTSMLLKGMLVAKSEHYAYMFQIID